MAKKNTGFLKWLLYWLARLSISLLSSIPVKVSCRLGAIVGGLLWRLLSKRRRIVEKNLKIVDTWLNAEGSNHGGSSVSSSKEVFRRTCGNMIAGFSFGRMSKERMKTHLDIQGIEHMQDALSEGRGVILILAHMGPWELLTAMAALGPELGIEAKMAAIYRPLDNDYLDAWVRRTRQKNNTTLFNRKDGFHKPASFVKEGNILGILSDQRASRGPRVPFFGRKVPTTPLPGLLHKRTDAPMLSLAVETTGLAKWRLTLFPVELPNELQNRTEDKEALARATNQALENSLSKSVNDAFWLHNRFR